MSQYLLHAGGYTGRITLRNVPGWDIVSGTPTVTASSVLGVTYSLDGTLAAFAIRLDNTGQHTLKVFTTSNWVEQFSTVVFSANGASAFSVAFSPNGQYLAVTYEATSSTPGFAVYTTSDWELVTGTPNLGTQLANSCTFSPDGQYLAVAHNVSPYLAIIDTNTWTAVAGTPALPTVARKVAFSPNGQYLAVGTSPVTSASSMYVYNTSDWSLASDDFLPPESGSNGGTSYGVAFSPDGVYLVTGNHVAPRMYVYYTADWSRVPGTPNVVTGGLNRQPWTFNFSSDSRYLAAGFEPNTDGSLRVFDTSNWSSVLAVNLNGSVISCQFSPPPEFLLATPTTLQTVASGGNRALVSWDWTA